MTDAKPPEPKPTGDEKPDAQTAKVYRSVTEIRRAFYPKASSNKKTAVSRRARNSVVPDGLTDLPTA